jgi:hypothetical protein
MDELWGGPDPLDPPPYLRHCLPHIVPMNLLLTVQKADAGRQQCETDHCKFSKIMCTAVQKNRVPTLQKSSNQVFEYYLLCKCGF